MDKIKEDFLKKLFLTTKNFIKHKNKIVINLKDVNDISIGNHPVLNDYACLIFYMDKNKAYKIYKNISNNLKYIILENKNKKN